MKIVHVANFYSEKSGGIKTTINELGIRYQRIGHQFYYVIPGLRFGVELTPSGTKISLPSIPIPFSGGYRIIRSNRELKRVLSLLQPQRLEVSDRLTLHKIGLWAMKRRIHSIVFSHESLESLLLRFFKFEQFRKLAQWHNRKLAGSFDWVVASTDYAAREFRALGIPNLKKIPLGVDLESFNPNSRDESFRQRLLQGSEILLVHCGRLSIEKNPEQSVEVLKSLTKEGVSARLVFVGMGPLYKKLKSVSVGFPVDFVGYVVGPKKVATYLSAADVVLAPGPHETFCLAALEALACGTPVVASSESAVREILRNERDEWAGRIVSENPDHWVEAVREIAATPQMRSTAREIAELFPWTTTIGAIESLEIRNSRNSRETDSKLWFAA